MSEDIKATPEQYLEALIKIEKGGRDAIGTLSQATLVGLGGLGAAASAGAIYGALGLGVTTVPATLLGSTTLAGLFGMAGTTVVAATPIGWTIGLGIAGAAAVYGLTHLLWGAGKQDEIRRRSKVDIRDQILKYMRGPISDDDTVKMVADCLHSAYVQKKIPAEFGARLIKMLHDKTVTPEYALKNIFELLESQEDKNSDGKSNNANAKQGFIVLSKDERQLQELLVGVDKTIAQRILEQLKDNEITINEAINIAQKLK